ncbi:hypothetical protein A8W25_28035 [Streptomyces sp. ERV7]|uniref:hypothetical protein n=1 Tax=Streptomyces sp. ERV7 TaxID=1322334 RepID=UPI0007F35C42|nr:hypothetical protein [Streptomyces sp. ERV7]OAR22000.1 hypothetical protein A8W25_28035 [Streptomyces sp. ERV7]
MTATATDGGRALPDPAALPALRPLAARSPHECGHPVLAAVLADLCHRPGPAGRAGAYFSDAPAAAAPSDAAGAYFADTPSVRPGEPGPGDVP